MESNLRIHKVCLGAIGMCNMMELAILIQILSVASTVA